jgi:RNA polymerase sigma-70 factor (ECF subfamily)
VNRTAPDDVATLYLQYGASVVRRAAQILRSGDDAQEILQDVFARLLARPELMDRARDPSTFLYAVTTNACLNRLRDQRHRARLVEREVRPWQHDVAPGSSQDRAIVLDLLVKLPEDEASAAIYYYLDGMSHLEIADVLGCSRRHVGNLIDRVQARVRRLVEEAI